MSVSHPFLKQLKVHIIRFCDDKTPVRDDHDSVISFCRALEDVMKHGLRGSLTKFSGEVQKTYWQWLFALLRSFDTRKLGAPLTFCLEYARECKKAITDAGKGRLFLRCALNKKVLTKAIRLLKSQTYLVEDYYDDMSLLGNEILSELFLSLLIPLESHVTFGLNIRVSSFLDETWELPVFRQYELVPCDRMGVSLQIANGRVIVVEVEPGSVADEDLKIEPGDILDDLFGESLRRGSIRKVMQLMDEYKGSPIYVSVIKCLDQNGRFFRSIYTYLEESSLCKKSITANRERRVKEILDQGGPSQWLAETSSAENHMTEHAHKTPLAGTDDQPTETGIYTVELCGFVHVGRVGTVEQIETGVLSVIKQEEPKRKVLIELGETDVTVYSADNNTVLLRHGYPEIASCGRRTDYPLNFSYIAGETTCTLAKKFFCYVFQSNNEKDAKTILKGIAEGFERTHWAV